MSTERLRYLLDVAEGQGVAHIPVAIADYLRESLRRWEAGLPLDRAFQLDPAPAKRERDEMLRRHARELPGRPKTRAKIIADQVRALRGGGDAAQWIVAADRIHPLPESVRQLLRIIADDG